MTAPSTKLRYKIQYDFEDVTVIIASPIYDSIIDHVILDELVIDFDTFLEDPSFTPSLDRLSLLNDRIKDFLRMWGIYGSNSQLMNMKLRDDVNLIRVGDNT